MGTLAPAGTSNSNIATDPPEAWPSTRNRTVICPTRISSRAPVAISSPPPSHQCVHRQELLDMWMRGFAQIRHGAEVDRPALKQDDDLIRNAAHQVQIVGHNNAGQ